MKPPQIVLLVAAGAVGGALLLKVAQAPAPEPHKVTLNAGLLLPVHLVDGLSSERGARVPGRVVASGPGGKLKGGAAIGGGDVIPARGKPATLPSETRIGFRLRAPLTLTGRL